MTFDILKVCTVFVPINSEKLTNMYLNDISRKDQLEKVKLRLLLHR